MSQEHTEAELAKRGRLVALVIAGSMLLWLLAQALGAFYGWPGRVALLIDLAVLAALLWSMIVTYQIWRRRRDMKG